MHESTNAPAQPAAPTPAAPARKNRWFEPATVILMALTTIATTWCSYESSRWSGRSSGFQNQTNELQRDALAMHLESNQIESMHADAFMAMINAKLNGNEKLADFYVARFSGELKPAYQKWLALKPFENAAAPPHPFVPEIYVPRFETEIRTSSEEAALDQKNANTSGTNAANYLSNTVLLAAVLFFAGTASKFEQPHVRISSFAFAATFFIYAVVRLFMLPVA